MKYFLIKTGYVLVEIYNGDVKEKLSPTYSCAQIVLRILFVTVLLLCIGGDCH